MPKGLEGFVRTQNDMVKVCYDLLGLVKEANDIMTLEERNNFKHVCLPLLREIVASAKGLM